MLSGSEQAFVFFGGAEGLEEGCTLVLKRLEGPHSILEEGENTCLVNFFITTTKTIIFIETLKYIFPSFLFCNVFFAVLVTFKTSME